MQVFVLERVIPPLMITFKSWAVNSVSSNHIFALFLFLFNSHYLKKVSMDSVQNLSIKIKKYPWTWSMTGGPWNRSKVGVHGPLIHVLSFGSKAITGSSFQIKAFPSLICLLAGWLVRIQGKFLEADPPSSGFMNGDRQNFPPIHTSGMSLSSQTNRSSDRLYM